MVRPRTARLAARAPKAVLVAGSLAGVSDAELVGEHDGAPGRIPPNERQDGGHRRLRQIVRYPCIGWGAAPEHNRRHAVTAARAKKNRS